jgi:hypothetical protein
MAHPSGVVVDIVGIESPDRGRNCELHACCGTVLGLDTVVRFRAVQISVDGQEQSAIAVYWVTDGIDRCRVGFLRRHLLKHKDDYDGKLGQVVEIMGLSKDKALRKKSYHYKGWVTSVLIEVEQEEGKKKRPLEEPDTDLDETPVKTRKKS